MSNVPISKKTLNEFVENINKEFDKEVISVSLEDGKYKTSIFGYGIRVLPTLLEAITFVQGVGVGILIKSFESKLK